MRKRRIELAGTKLRLRSVDVLHDALDNQRAWEAILPFLSDERFRVTGLPYELLSRKARNAASSVTEKFINYCEERGYLEIADDAQRARLRPGEHGSNAQR